MKWEKKFIDAIVSTWNLSNDGNDEDEARAIADKKWQTIVTRFFFQLTEFIDDMSRNLKYTEKYQSRLWNVFVFVITSFVWHARFHRNNTQSVDWNVFNVTLLEHYGIQSNFYL